MVGTDWHQHQRRRRRISYIEKRTAEGGGSILSWMRSLESHHEIGLVFILHALVGWGDNAERRWFMTEDRLSLSKRELARFPEKVVLLRGIANPISMERVNG